MSRANKVLLSFGHGYSAKALAPHLLSDGWRIFGTTRSEEKRADIAATGVEALKWPGEDLKDILATADHLLISAAPNPEGDPVLMAFGKEIAAHARRLRWVGYLSTTGVYGDHAGAWVDEHTALNPATKRGQLRVEAETAWRDIPDLPLHIFRLAGIYGPGRGPFAKVRKGTARRIIKAGQIFSRIHVEDIAQALLLSIASPTPGSIYNLCDDEPAPPEDVIAHAAALLSLPIPPAVAFEEAEMTPMARSFYAESKKVRNDLIKKELGWKPIYPNYRTGLTSLLASSG
ncbi:MAG: SDR family oxidoreductase [Pseudomonadota bacterium]